MCSSEIPLFLFGCYIVFNVELLFLYEDVECLYFAIEGFVFFPQFRNLIFVLVLFL
jgi:hypothetical protein